MCAANILQTAIRPFFLFFVATGRTPSTRTLRTPPKLCTTHSLQTNKYAQKFNTNIRIHVPKPKTSPPPPIIPYCFGESGRKRGVERGGGSGFCYFPDSGFPPTPIFCPIPRSRRAKLRAKKGLPSDAPFSPDSPKQSVLLSSFFFLLSAFFFAPNFATGGIYHRGYFAPIYHRGYPPHFGGVFTTGGALYHRGGGMSEVGDLTSNFARLLRGIGGKGGVGGQPLFRPQFRPPTSGNRAKNGGRGKPESEK